MAHIEFGFIMPADQLDKTRRGAYVEDLNRALAIVEDHFASAWCIDHLQTGDDDQLEGWTALCYMAAQHPRLKLGHTVLCQSYRNPALLAKMAATLQFLSGGRFVLGLGAGWHEEEFRAYGYDFPAAGVRVEQLDETLQIIRALWGEGPATFEGRHYHVTNAYCEPRPDPVPPLMIGAFRPKMLRLTAQYADWWNASSTGIHEYRRLSAQLDAACTEIGRDPATLRRTWGGGCVCAPTEARARAVGGTRYGTENEDDYNFVGTPAQVAAQMQPFIDMGVDYFMVDCGGWPDLTTLELLVSEVLPRLKEA
jgi:alkanesulfonate monooxygenase SsuD/methylene tetrahydromethanopterin reductase-like flavin-dependent oxidoreductase (luciferase family)